MFCVETKNLTHKFSEQEAVLRNINMQVPQGSIYGFLGPNGAGKTTTLKLILGLLKKQEGDIFIFNKPFADNRIELLKNIGSLIESPSLYGHLTAIENLKVWQKLYQCPVQRINEVLEIVGLTKTGNKKVTNFSLGMKQRLSIAVALLHNPALLILDEPTNGLDPNGIIEMRELLKQLNKEHGITIVISSHLLPEIEKLVTHIGIINKGAMMFQGTLPELLNKQQQTSFISIDTNDAEKTMQIINSNNINAHVEQGKIQMPLTSKKNIAAITKQLIESSIEVYEITTVKNDLEVIFMDLINN